MLDLSASDATSENQLILMNLSFQDSAISPCYVTWLNAEC
jgi:hypothetical protein